MNLKSSKKDRADMMTVSPASNLTGLAQPGREVGMVPDG